ncbi:CC0125/CC1285 family lipoprotein [Woodsholea maritima]|uniref:CC0125/CC1285 family lipoprotein n=1 Tax=Woodsholea maritima TaxID=240237 RepID=UPI00035F0BC0|nr:hypothetical protein [Woodsholea maritima]
MKYSVFGKYAFLGLAAMGLTLSACSANSTPYQAISDTSRYGYSEQRIEGDRYQVRFAGNSLTDRETVETFLLYRAAELTLTQGYDFFHVVNRDTDEETRYRGNAYDSHYGMHYRYYHPAYGWYGWRDPFWDDINMREISRYEAFGEIVMGHGAKPNDPNAYDARSVVENLGPRVRQPSTR